MVKARRDDESLVVVLDERLAEPGELLALKGTLATPDYEVGERNFSVPKGIAYDLTLTNTGGAILAQGNVEAELEGTCDRCLDPAVLELSGNVEVLFVPPGGEFQVGEDEGLEILPIEEDRLALDDPIRAAIAVEIPFKVLCRQDCKGLCPVCGQNLNEGSCDCAQNRADAELERNPFSVLKNLTFDEESS